jgi:hypothetical protein
MSERLYDLQQLRDLSAGSDEFVQSMIETFLEHTPVQLDEMVEAYESGDLNTVGSIAHKIKPNIDLFNINAISDDIRVVEERGKAGISDDTLHQSLSRVKDILRESFNQMR